jgi:hypothetical protein
MRLWANCWFHVGDLCLWMHMIDVYWISRSRRHLGHLVVGLYSMVCVRGEGWQGLCAHLM